MIPAAGARARWALCALVGVAFLVPVALVRYPPVLDLAQQMAQMPLLERALEHRSEIYEVQWLAPNRLAYLVLGLGWWSGGAEHGPRIALALATLAAVGAIHALGAVLQRPLANVLLASVFVFSSSYYGGFFNFLLGGWGLVLWLRELSGRAAVTNARAAFARAAGIGLVFYFTHLMWLPAALGLLAVGAAARREARRWLLPRALGLLPFLLAGWAWDLSTRDPQRAGLVVWERSLWTRLTMRDEWTTYLLGGLKGWIEPALLAALALWAVVVVVRGRRGESMPGADRDLAWAACAFLAAALLLPDTVGETWFFGRRWGFWAGVCAILALPSPGFRGRGSLALAACVPAALVAVTVNVWVQFDRETMRGFESAIAKVPAGSSLLQLDFARHHPRLWIYPTFQMAAYVQLDRDVRLGFSFAEHRSSLVVYRGLPVRTPWTPLLEHLPGKVKDRDFDYFQYALLHLPQGAFEQLPVKLPRLDPIAGEGAWWLCRVREAS